jgi:hypothetical protein
MQTRNAPIKSVRVVATINSTAYIADATYINRDVPLRFIVSTSVGTPTNVETIINQIEEQHGASINGQPVTYEMMHDHIYRDPARVPKTAGSVRPPTITDCTL